MSPLDLIRSKGDGTMSITKLSATVFHALLAVAVAFITWHKKSFEFDMWGLYATVAVGHASYDKTMAMIVQFKTNKAVVPTPPAEGG